MARQMNVDKRVTAAKAIVERAATNAGRATAMAEELTASFEGVKTDEAKAARELAKKLVKLSGQLSKVSEGFANQF